MFSSESVSACLWEPWGGFKQKSNKTKLSKRPLFVLPSVPLVRKAWQTDKLLELCRESNRLFLTHHTVFQNSRGIDAGCVTLGNLVVLVSEKFYMYFLSGLGQWITDPGSQLATRREAHTP